ncbi:hypothetical protein HAX54_002069, partial [Datura stramonium]|nr:hypothetical protein [Datura stramonium]
MASRANKGKEVATSRKGVKRLRKGVDPGVQPHLSEGVLCQLEHFLWRDTKVRVRGQVGHFTVRAFNVYLSMLEVDQEMYFVLLEKPPYRDIHHTLCGENLASRWARSKIG